MWLCAFFSSRVRRYSAIDCSTVRWVFPSRCASCARRLVLRAWASCTFSTSVFGVRWCAAMTDRLCVLVTWACRNLPRASALVGASCGFAWVRSFVGTASGSLGAMLYLSRRASVSAATRYQCRANFLLAGTSPSCLTHPGFSAASCAPLTWASCPISRERECRIVPNLVLCRFGWFSQNRSREWPLIPFWICSGRLVSGRSMVGMRC